MKTDQVLTVNFKYGEFKVKHRSLLVETDHCFNVINRYRLNNNLHTVLFRDWMKTISAREYVSTLTNDGYTAVIIGKGRSKSYIHLKVAIRAAIDLSPHFADELIDMFLHKKLTILRNTGGDLYLDVVDVMSYFGKKNNIDIHKGHIITINKLIKKTCGLDSDWNKATPEQHNMRNNILKFLYDAIRFGIVNDWQQIKFICSNYCTANEFSRISTSELEK